MKQNFNKFLNHLVTQGFFYPNSQIYGGLANSWDYGPLGVEIKHNLKNIWWNFFVNQRNDIVGLDSAIISNPKIWESSGHLKNFQDPLIDCKSCKNRYRIDELVENQTNLTWNNKFLNNTKLFISQNNIVCPTCKSQNFTDVRFFNLMFKTQNKVLEQDESALYLRPETTQGIFVNFKNILRSTRAKIPFGVAQMGKSFRNEISPNNFIFRTKEFEQMEIAFFCTPESSVYWFDYWKNEIFKFFKKININSKSIQLYEHKTEELAHYAAKTIDFKFNFPFGWQELWGLSNRQNYDLKNHNQKSLDNMEYHDPDLNIKYFPYVIEPSVGVERLILAILWDNFKIDILEDESERIVLTLPWVLSPYQIMVTPLSKKLDKFAKPIFTSLLRNFKVMYDVSGSIGKRYRRADAIGINYAITYDFESVNDNMVTIRERDTMKQWRIKISELFNYFQSKNSVV